jgi:hypothetical protein
MAKTDAVKGLRLDMIKVHVLVILLGLLVLVMIYSYSIFGEEVPTTLFIGLLVAAVGVALTAASIYFMGMGYMAVGAALQLVGCALASIDVLDLENLLTLLIVTFMVPLTLAQYQMGATMVSIKGYLSAEGTDYPPAIKGLRQYIMETIQDMTRMVILSFIIALLVLLLVALYRDVMALNSLALMGTLVVTIIAGASLLILLKGGKISVLEGRGDIKEKEAEKGEAA